MSDLLAMNTDIAAMQATQNKDAIDAVKKARNMERIEKAAEDFEAVFIAEMMKPMFEGLSTDGPFNGGKGEEIFRGMMLQEYGKEIARTNSFGIAEQVKAEMIKQQEQR
jgi:Rod binding domain-containing protein